MADRLGKFFTISMLACFLALHSKPAAAASKGNVDGVCKQPSQISTFYEQDGAVLEVWTIYLADVATNKLPDGPAFKAYRNVVKKSGADIRRPALIVPTKLNKTETNMWRSEQFNNELVFSGRVGSVTPISCLDALLFSRQANRVSQVERPTEFIASVLRKEASTGTKLIVVFGAGTQMFPPKTVYGLDVVDSFLAEGWHYWYMFHNHTLQQHGDVVTLGIPAPSLSDLQFVRALAKSHGLEAVRVTNGFYTFSASVNELGPLR